MKTYPTNSQSKCPNCGGDGDAASGCDGAPRPGDVSICLFCGHICEFTSELKLSTISNDHPLFLSENSVELGKVKAIRQSIIQQN